MTFSRWLLVVAFCGSVCRVLADVVCGAAVGELVLCGAFVAGAFVAGAFGDFVSGAFGDFVLCGDFVPGAFGDSVLCGLRITDFVSGAVGDLVLSAFSDSLSCLFFAYFFSSASRDSMSANEFDKIFFKYCFCLPAPASLVRNM